MSLDPGGTTGWADYTADMLFVNNEKPEYFNEKFNSGEIGKFGLDHHRELYNLLSTKLQRNFIIICESFEHRPRMEAAELVSNEYIGVVKYFQQVHRLPVVWQTKSYGCSFFDDKKLKKLGKHNQTPQGHANDAMRHLLQYLTHGSLARKDILMGLK